MTLRTLSPVSAATPPAGPGLAAREPAPARTCAEALVTLLENYQVTHIFGIPGVHTVELYRGLASSSIRHVTPRHEQGAGFMADGYARITGQPGVCFVITGPGMTNIATAMGQAYADSIPMLVISSVNARHQMGLGNGCLHELPSQREVFSTFTAFSHTLLDPADLPHVLARAFAVFEGARPRPVHIEIPLDVLVAPAQGVALDRFPVVARPAPANGNLMQAAAMLDGAVKPLILAGGGALEAATELRAIAERLQAPVTLTINAKGLLPPSHPLLLGSTQSLSDTRAMIREADVVLAVGTELAETDYDTVFDGGFKIDGRLIRIDIDAQQVMRQFRPDVAIVSDAREALSQLHSELSARPPMAPRAVTPAWGARRVAAVRQANDSRQDAVFLAQKRFIETVLQALPDAVIVGDSTQPVYVGNLTHDAAAPRSWFNSTTGYGTLGYALPAALGAKLAAPERPVICLIGDGGLQFTLPELASAVEAGVPVIVLLWNNAGYQEIRKAMLDRKVVPIGVDIGTPDFIALAKGFACHAVRVDTAAALSLALRQAAQAHCPTLIEIDEDRWCAAHAHISTPDSEVRA